jgi:hypothetical protein
MSDSTPHRLTRQPLEYLKVPLGLFREFDLAGLSLTQQAIVLRLRALQAELGYLPVDLGREVSRMNGGRPSRHLEAVETWFPMDETGTCRRCPEVERARNQMLKTRADKAAAGRARARQLAAEKTEKGRREAGEWPESGRRVAGERSKRGQHMHSTC